MPVTRIMSTGFVLAAAAAAMLLAGCGTGLRIGDTGAVREANELAIECRHDEALQAVDQAEQGGGLGAAVAGLQRVVVLRDAGRTGEATAAMDKRNRSLGVDAKNAAEAERAVEESLKELRGEREK